MMMAQQLHTITKQLPMRGEYIEKLYKCCVAMFEGYRRIISRGAWS